jgi:signal transduction histidine kinase
MSRRLGTVTGDERKFKQILLNLLSNAVKFTPDGGRVDVSAKREQDHSGRREDTGIGIAAADRRRCSRSSGKSAATTRANRKAPAWVWL